MNDLVSVIIPCYQQAHFLHEAVSSLLAQSHTNWEAIIVNDGSTDETSSISRSLCETDPRVHYVQKTNGGLSSARNAGIKASHGDFIQFLDADDRLDSKKCELQIGVLRGRSEVGIVYGNAKYFTDGAFDQLRRSWLDNGSDEDWITARWKDSRPLLRKLIDRNMFPVCSPLLRRSVVDHIGLFNENLTVYEDWEYWTRCAAAGVQFMFHEAVGTEAFIRVHGTSLTTNQRQMQLGEFLARMAYHNVLPSGDARNINSERMLRCNSSIGRDGRADRFIGMSLECRTLRERSIVLISKYCDIYGPLNPFARRLGHRLPLRIRRRLLDMGLDFAR